MQALLPSLASTKRSPMDLLFHPRLLPEGNALRNAGHPDSCGTVSIFFKFPGAIVYGAVLPHKHILCQSGSGSLSTMPSDLFRSQRILGGRLNIHAIHILLAFRNITLEISSEDTLLQSPFDNLVIDIRKVGNIIHIVAFSIQKLSPHRIKYDHRPAFPM